MDSSAATMTALRWCCYGNSGAITSRAAHTGLRRRWVIVAHVCVIRSGGIVSGGLSAICAVAVPRPMSMPTMPKQVHCDHAAEKDEPDPVVAHPVHRSLQRSVGRVPVNANVSLVPRSRIDTGQSPDSASGTSMDKFSAIPCAAR